LVFHFTQNGCFGQIWVDLSHLFYPIWADFGKLGGFWVFHFTQYGQIWTNFGFPFYPIWAGLGKFGWVFHCTLFGQILANWVVFGSSILLNMAILGKFG
jgi:hypothetical protein